MAKLDWNKNHINQKIRNQTCEEIKHNHSKQDFWLFIKKGLWPVKGKHKGKPINDLDTNYLIFIEKRFQGIPKNIATKELNRRQIKR